MRQIAQLESDRAKISAQVCLTFDLGAINGRNNEAQTARFCGLPSRKARVGRAGVRCVAWVAGVGLECFQSGYKEYTLARFKWLMMS